ncbi:hypothetical protein [Paenibacillus hunanensis]|uniref:Uncharacterized protein n=1 Tax=Paenibacillus hunanensis TaxID=539262 RepID=A0ABU1J5A4_9BACL|nr:hypothetical protein [Paenibacillus hunanensis]MDR6246674.1 hypothetical protein [Paenibacillus hunanensis]GGJ32435.1 hypothetical protein GCM10008022_46380 [Paenibacillus hunanensis]
MIAHEVEVLSVSAGDTILLTKKHFIHACPHHRRGYQYKPSTFITFRAAQGGEMEFIYKIKNIVVIDPFASNMDKVLEEVEPDFSERIKSYHADRLITKIGFEYKNELYRFYDLDQNDIIELKHLPKPKNNNSGGWYYTVEQLVSGEKIIK